MKKRLVNGSCIAILLLAASAAQAAGWSHTKGSYAGTVRSAQERLNQLGYYSGRVDGVVGYQTRQAISAFQLSNGFVETGTLTAETHQQIGSVYAQARDSYRDGAYTYPSNYATTYNGRPYHNGYVDPAAMYHGRASYYQQAAWAPAPAWNRAQVQALSVRYGQMAVVQDANNYSVTLNGQPVLNAANQPAALRVSQTYRLGGEDAVIFSAYDGAGGCGYKNYLLTVKDDGTYTPAQQIGNCSSNYQARVDGNMLYITFANPDGTYDNRDIWRYTNNTVGRVYDTMARL